MTDKVPLKEKLGYGFAGLGQNIRITADATVFAPHCLSALINAPAVLRALDFYTVLNR